MPAHIDYLQSLTCHNLLNFEKPFRVKFDQFRSSSVLSSGSVTNLARKKKQCSLKFKSVKDFSFVHYHLY